MTIIKVTRHFIKITTFFSSEKFKEMMSSTRRPKSTWAIQRSKLNRKIKMSGTILISL